MPNHLSTLGIIHTSISIIAVLIALFCLNRAGRIDPANKWGKAYVWLTVITCLTGLPIMKTGHFTPGHYDAILVLLLLPLGVFAKNIFGKAANYLQVIIMSTTLFLSLIPAVVETLTRLPLSHPLAADAGDPIAGKALSGLFLLFIVGVVYQIVKMRKSNQPVAAK